MNKRIISLCLALALLCAILPELTLPARAADYSGDCGENLTWSFDPDTGILTIEGSGPMWDYNPSHYDSRDVPWSTYRKSIVALSLPEELTSIGEYAFYYCTGLTSVTIPERVTCIRAGAFEECNALKRVVLQGNQTYVDTVTFITDWDGNDATPEDASWCETLGPKAQVTIYGPGAASDGDYHSADF